MKNYLLRFRNTGTIISIVSLLGLLLVQFGVKINLEWVDSTIKLICSLGVGLGVLNNPTTPGIDLPTQEAPKEINPSGEITDFRG